MSVRPSKSAGLISQRKPREPAKVGRGLRGARAIWEHPILARFEPFDPFLWVSWQLPIWWGYVDPSSGTTERARGVGVRAAQPVGGHAPDSGSGAEPREHRA